MEEKQDKDFHSGMVSIVGRPNVGKSTLLNLIVGEKVAIVSPIPQTTRNRVRGVYNDERSQIVFIDTPGLHMSKDKLDQFMNRSAYGTTRDADCIIHLVDANDPVGPEEEKIVKKLAALKVAVVLGLNKVDLKGEFIHEYIALWERVKGVAITEIENFTILPLSTKTGLHQDKLIGILFDYLPQGPALYPRDTVCDIPQKMVIADIIREKLLGVMRQEVPHSLAVIVEEMEPRQGKTIFIRALILVERASQKNIVIGKDGQILKKVGSMARIEIENLIENKVFLDLYVKMKKKWRDDQALLMEMGYADL
ncbi:MAG: GTPase Era [Candidatus Omnitrophica bacterium]|nr:GTPase Era [Candidatus Omnitrophota bacterium]